MRYLLAFLALLFGSQLTQAQTFRLSVNQVFSPTEAVKCQIYRGYYRDRSDLATRMTLYKIPEPKKVLAEKAFYGSGINFSDKLLRTFEKQKSWVQNIPNKYSFEFEVGKLEAGLYLMEAYTATHITQVPVLVSDYGLLVKSTQSQTLALLTDSEDRAQTDFEAFRFHEDSLYAATRFEQELAVFEVSPKTYNNAPVFAFKDGQLIASQSYFYHYGSENNMTAYVFTDRPAYRPEQTVNFQAMLRQKNGFLFEIPDDTVQIAIIFEKNKEAETEDDNDWGYWGRTERSVIKSYKMPLDADGILFDSLVLDKKAKLGTYTVVVGEAAANAQNWLYSGGFGRAEFQLQEYKKPEYEVKVALGKSQYQSGDELKATVSADYFFGAPVQKGEVEYFVVRTKYYRPWWENSPFAWWYRGWYSADSERETVHRGEGKLDKDGKFEITYDTSEDLKKSDRQNYRYTISASVRDASRRNIGGSSSVIVAHAAFTLTAHSPKYFYSTDEEAIIHAKTADFSGKAVAAPITLRIFDRETQSRRPIYETTAQTAAETGEAELRFSLPQTGYYRAEVTGTDEKGREITDETSLYVIGEGENRYWWWGDDEGTIEMLTDKKVYEAGEKVGLMLYIPHNADALLTISSTEFAYKNVRRFRTEEGKGKQLQLPLDANAFGKLNIGIDYIAEGKHYSRTKQIIVIPRQKYLNVRLEFDREEYRPTTEATAKVIVTDHEGKPVPNARLTLSTADQSIYSLYPETNADIRQVFYESPSYSYQNGQFNSFSRTSYTQDLTWKNIIRRQSEGLFERKTYLPEDKDYRLQYHEKTSEKSSIRGFVVEAKTGKPIPNAKIKLGKKTFRTDEHGFYALTGFTTSAPTLKFSAGKARVEITNFLMFADRDLYLNVGLLEDEKQTFEVMEDEAFAEAKKEAGDGEKLPTYSEEIEVDLAVEIDQETVVEEVAVEGAYEADMAMASPQMDKRSASVPVTEQPAPPAPPAPEYKKATLRKNFRDAIYWNPRLKTDENGEAIAKIRLPDNLTTWRTFVKVITPETEVGQTMAKVVVTKNLLVRMETPRLLTVGDRLVVATTIHNYLPSRKRVKVSLKANGLVVKGTEREITIAANGEERLDWKVDAKWAMDAAKLTVEALTDEESDAKRLAFPVRPHGLEMVKAEAANLQDKANQTLTFTLPEGIDPNTASIELDVSPSIASALLSSMDQLIGYPYGCTEQTMSRFLPNVLVANTLKTLGTDYESSVSEAELQKMTDKGLARLAELQHDDGGWGWWKNDQTHPFFTAYVTNGLFLAQEAGYEVNPAMYAKAKRALSRQISKATTTEATTQAYEMSVAMRIGLDSLWDTKRMPKPHLMNGYQKALWLQSATMQSDKKLQKTLLASLTETAEKDGRFIFWGGKKFSYSWHDDRVETTANVVKALLEVDPESELIVPAVEWLMSQRRGVAWHNTRQTAVTIFALNDLLKRELNTDTEVAIFANDTKIGTHQFTQKDALGRGQTYTLRNAEYWVSLTGGDTDKLRVLKPGKNTIKIVQTGTGTTYANARLRYFADQQQAKSMESSGFELEREYFTLTPKVTKKGLIEYEKTKTELSEIKSGDVLLVKVKVEAASTKENVLIEDPIPAGCAFIRDTKPYIIPDEPDYDGKRESRNWWEWDNVWYTHREYRDGHFAMTITELPAGEYEYSYLLKAELLGKYRVTPAVIQRMYYPEQRGWSEFVEVEIGE